MTDLQAITQYRAAKVERAVILDIKVPWIFLDDPEALKQYQNILQRGLDQTEKTILQAEQAIEQLPREEWKDIFVCRFIHGMDWYQTAEQVNYSMASVFRYARQAIDYLQTLPDK